MVRNELIQIAKVAAKGSKDDLINLLESKTTQKPGWRGAIDDCIDFLYSGKPNRSIFTKGNSKLPFYSFSVLPLVTCPGMGKCGSYCYSLKAWRYPMAFFRQLQNTILMRENFGAISNAFDLLNKPNVVRLYVDGDFSSGNDLERWMGLVKQNPQTRFYGYSKSWKEFLAYNKKQNGNWPINYMLNLSNGSRHSGEVREKMLELACTRGSFDVVSEWGKGVFRCPGKCGSCIPNGEHACGSEKFRGVRIEILKH